MLRLRYKKQKDGWTNFARDDRGVVAMIFALAVFPILLALGAAIDYQRAMRVQAAFEEAAESGALAAATRASLTAAQRKAAGETTASANLISLTGAAGVPTETEPSSGNYQVTVTGSMKTTFMQLAGISSVPLKATAIAKNPNVASGGSMSSSTPPCFLAKATSASQAFLANSGATIKGSTCEIDVASTASTAAMLNSGASFTLKKLCIAGSNITNNGATFNPSSSVLQTGCTTPADPFAAAMPTVSVGSCTVKSQNYSGTVNLSPGVYCGGFNFNGSGTLNLAPGLYIFKGVSWNLNSSWSMTGAGVTLYFADSSYLQFNGNAHVSLSAPTTGTYANILMFEAPGLSTSGFTINGGASSSSGAPDSLSGLIYLPSRNLTFNSGASVNSASIALVVNTVIMDQVTWNFTPLTNWPGGTASQSPAYLTSVD